MNISKQINESCEHHPHTEHTHEHSGNFSQIPDGITCKIHDGALVVSGNKHIFGDLEPVKQNLEREIGQLDTWVEEHGGITGHIKAIVSVNGPVCRISATGGEVESKNLQLKDTHISIVAIVFQIDQEAMEQRMEALLENMGRA